MSAPGDYPPVIMSELGTHRRRGGATKLRPLSGMSDDGLYDRLERAKLPVAVRLPHRKLEVRKRKLLPLDRPVD